jgi:hypothetical protein
VVTEISITDPELRVWFDRCFASTTAPVLMPLKAVYDEHQRQKFLERVEGIGTALHKDVTVVWIK